MVSSTARPTLRYQFECRIPVSFSLGVSYPFTSVGCVTRAGCCRAHPAKSLFLVADYTTVVVVWNVTTYWTSAAIGHLAPPDSVRRSRRVAHMAALQLDCAAPRLHPFAPDSRRLSGRVVMQRPAKPSTPVRFRPQPPNRLPLDAVTPCDRGRAGTGLLLP